MPDLPIPTRLANRPVQGGLVVPVVSVMMADGRAAFGDLHNNKAVRCIVNDLCQACGQKLGRPVVVFVTVAALETRYSSEPPLHPECAAYAAKACPMLAGRMTHYRSSPSPHLGKPCDTPGCTCDGWVQTNPDRETNAGKPADGWVAVWLADYAVVINDAREVHGVGWTSTPLKVRPVAPAGVS